ncbi:MAG: hypothetical protein J5545_10790 [Bacteroidaceae bacterium]|nr:hypothetical protein [Bacteroidaceae bacterium]
MKKTLLFLLLTAIFMVAATGTAQAQTKLEKRYTYTLKNLKLDKATAEKFGPVLKAYLTDKKEAEDIYDDVKDKYKAAEKAGTLTDAQATELLNAKFESAEKELAVKKKYLAEFRKILKPKKVYYAFDLASDKMSKIDGKDKDKD